MEGSNEGGKNGAKTRKGGVEGRKGDRKERKERKRKGWRREQKSVNKDSN